MKPTCLATGLDPHAAASNVPCLPAVCCGPVDRQTRACRRQVCDLCGGPFGMVTYRWWGSKFCKKRCKETYVGGVAIGRDSIRRWLSVGCVSRMTSSIGSFASSVQ